MAKTPVPPNAAVFSVSVVGDKTGETYKADFVTTQILSHRQQLLSDRLFREYLGGENPSFADVDSKERARILSDINAALVMPIPQFWREKGMGLDLLDDNIITDVWANVLRVQSERAKEIADKAKKDAERLKGAVEKGADAESDDDE